MRAAQCGLAIALLLGTIGTGRACDRATYVVAIDPGHTRKSPGAISAHGLPEVQFNERLAREVKDALKRAGFGQTFLTNLDQGETTLLQRAERANDRNAKLFISIHHDSAQPQLLSTWQYGGQPRQYTDTIAGYSLFVSDHNPQAAQSLRFAHLLGARLRGRCLVPSLHHADKLPGEGRELLDQHLGIYRFDDLVVLHATNMPAVLFEAGVIVNRKEESLLRSPGYRNKLVDAVAGAVADFCADATAPRTPAGKCP
jgi:N-acetylmuramoyl-L-alanine amidase